MVTYNNFRYNFAYLFFSWFCSILAAGPQGLAYSRLSVRNIYTSLSQKKKHFAVLLDFYVFIFQFSCMTLIYEYMIVLCKLKIKAGVKQDILSPLNVCQSCK